MYINTAYLASPQYKNGCYDAHVSDVSEPLLGLSHYLQREEKCGEQYDLSLG